MESERIAELEKQNRDLHIRLRALEYSFMLSTLSIPPGISKIISERFGAQQQEIIKTMTDSEARENVEVAKLMKILMSHVLDHPRK